MLLWTDAVTLSYLSEPGGSVPLPVGLQVAAGIGRLVNQTQQLDSLCETGEENSQNPAFTLLNASLNPDGLKDFNVFYTGLSERAANPTYVCPYLLFVCLCPP